MSCSFSLCRFWELVREIINKTYMLNSARDDLSHYICKTYYVLVKHVIVYLSFSPINVYIVYIALLVRLCLVHKKV